MNPITIELIRTFYKKRKTDSHKGNYGHVLLIVGSHTKMGAAIISSKACLRAGAGLVTVLVDENEKNVIFNSIPEAMIHKKNKRINYKNFDSIGIGPGLGTGRNEFLLLNKVINSKNIPLVIDADALNCLSKHNRKSKLTNKCILTPHPKEFDRLFGKHNSHEDRIITAIEKAKELNLIIILKEHQTFITNGIDHFQNTTGNPGLAKGGSGDALTGIISALIAQKYSSLEASLLGVFIHGLAADLAINEQSYESLLITDVLEYIGKAFKRIENNT